MLTEDTDRSHQLTAEPKGEVRTNFEKRIVRLSRVKWQPGFPGLRERPDTKARALRKRTDELMATKRNSLRLTRQEVTDALTPGDWATRYPPLLTVEEAAALLQVSRSTIYQWHSSGRLAGCAQRLGKHLRFYRDRLILKLMNEGI